ncbi:T9SS type A sorting domain-containing protein [bacterium]|nr:T9SS type A sorting domain-containing protein [bacterium]MBU1636850.1 T9SS type A sorting domain-containing protein [bacterium]
MNCRLPAALLIALLILNHTETEARPIPSALDSTDRVTYVYDGPPVFFGPTNATVEIEVADVFDINDVDVLVSIQHTWDSDVTLRLENPAGETVVLVDFAGESGHNFTNTVFNDDAAQSIMQGSAPFTGSYRPLEPLSRFNGGSGTGTWILHLEDTFPSVDDGMLSVFELTLGGRIGGVVRGRVTELATQLPMSGVRLEYIDTPYSTITDEQGYYLLNSAEGTFDLLVSYPFWCSEEVASIEVTEDDTLDYDFQLGKPEAELSISSLNILAIQNEISTESFEINNTGNCPLDWSLLIEEDWITSNTMSGAIPGETGWDFEINVDANDLEIGDYLSRIVITHNAEGSPHSIPVFVSVIALEAGDSHAIPQGFALLGSYPNPFNAATSIRYALPSQSDVRLLLYTNTGRLIKEMTENRAAPGIHEFRLDLSTAASGLYFAQLTAGDFSAVQKLILIK